MKKSRFFLALLFVSLLFVLFPATAKADMWDVPVGPGESFRWVFVTSGTTRADSPDISYYNDFVNAAADAAGTPIIGVVGKSTIADIQWMAIASTAATDAIDNIGVSPSGIFRFGTLVANGTGDMFDGSLLAPIDITELGQHPTMTWVWTGTDIYGLATSHPLGDPSVATLGLKWAAPPQAWICLRTYVTSLPLHVYAISEELQVVPAPAALLLAATGLLSSALGLNRLRRKR